MNPVQMPRQGDQRTDTDTGQGWAPLASSTSFLAERRSVAAIRTERLRPVKPA